jgi:hypothetical protein
VQGVESSPPPPSRTKWTRRVPHPVLIGHAADVQGVANWGSSNSEYDRASGCLARPATSSARRGAVKCYLAFHATAPV